MDMDGIAIPEEGAVMPEDKTEIDNLTKYNTANNRRISMVGITDDNTRKTNSGRKRRHVSFIEDEIVINPDGIDPNIRCFSNPSQSKRMNLGNTTSVPYGLTATTMHDMEHEYMQPPMMMAASYQGIPVEPNRLNISGEFDTTNVPFKTVQFEDLQITENKSEPQKKKYAKETWPGRK